jgi:phage portal protein BeeE
MELTDNRKFQVEEICRLFNVPPQMVNGTSGYSNEVFIAFVQNAVKPVAEEFAQRFTKLLPLEARGRHQYEWDYQSLERTNSTQQMANIKDRLTYGI